MDLGQRHDDNYRRDSSFRIVWYMDTNCHDLRPIHDHRKSIDQCRLGRICQHSSVDMGDIRLTLKLKSAQGFPGRFLHDRAPLAGKREGRSLALS